MLFGGLDRVVGERFLKTGSLTGIHGIVRNGFADDLTGDGHGAEADLLGTYDAAHSAEENGRFVKEHALGGGTDQGRRRLVAGFAPGGEVKVNKAAADLGVDLAGETAGDQGVTEIDERAHGHAVHHDRLLETHGMGCVRLLLEKRAAAEMAVCAGLGAGEQCAFRHVAAGNGCAGTDHGAVDHRRAFGADLSAGTDERAASRKPGARI